MTDITQTPDHYPEGVYQLAVTDPVLGGPEGADNKAPIDLANRTNYQRMRNVTPWRPGLENQYPAHAYVQHAGTTWKSKIANANVEPGTDAAKWIRWAYTADELLAYLDTYIASGVLNPYALDVDLAAYLLISQFDAYVFNKGIRYDAAVCPNTGPAAAPTLAAPANVRKSALGEVWMYLDNTWRVVANKYLLQVLGGAVGGTGVLPGVNLATFVAPRSGTLTASVSVVGVLFAASGLDLSTGIFVNGAQRWLQSGMTSTANAGTSVNEGTAATFNVAQGDVIETFIYSYCGYTISSSASSFCYIN